MGKDFHEAKRVLNTLHETLSRRGYNVSVPWRDGPMSSGRMSLSGSTADVRVLADRGQWFIEIRPTTEDSKWFDLELWSSCLGQPASFHVDARSMETKDVAAALAASWRLEPQVSWLESNLDMIERACSARESRTVLDCLRLRAGRD
jgi:hypothetical protein